MSQRTAIEWTDVTWNPVHGCSVVSPGCAHCYAATLSLRYGHTRKPWTPANAAENVVLHPERLDQPLRWRRPRMIFVNSMSDLFHEEVPDEYIARVFSVMAATPQHTYQVLTKRPERMRDCVRGLAWELPGDGSRGEATIYRPAYGIPAEPLPNVWLGVSIENRRFVHRADLLRETPAAVRFISAEPLLGPLVPHYEPDEIRVSTAEEFAAQVELDLTGIDWCIVGGESGKGARRFDLRWARDLRDACGLSGTAFFVKQLGGARPGTKLEGLPEDLRIREFPQAVRA